MLLDPSGRALGMDAMLPYFQVLPFADVLFRDLTFSGWALLIVNGLTNLTAAGLLLAEKRAGLALLRFQAADRHDQNPVLTCVGELPDSGKNHKERGAFHLVGVNPGCQSLQRGGSLFYARAAA